VNTFFMSGTPVRNSEPLLRERGFGARFGGGPTAPGRLRRRLRGWEPLPGRPAEGGSRGRPQAGSFVRDGRGTLFPPGLQARKPGFGTLPCTSPARLTFPSAYPPPPDEKNPHLGEAAPVGRLPPVPRLARPLRPAPRGTMVRRLRILSPGHDTTLEPGWRSPRLDSPRRTGRGGHTNLAASPFRAHSKDADKEFFAKI